MAELGSNVSLAADAAMGSSSNPYGISLLPRPVRRRQRVDDLYGQVGGDDLALAQAAEEAELGAVSAYDPLISGSLLADALRGQTQMAAQGVAGARRPGMANPALAARQASMDLGAQMASTRLSAGQMATQAAAERAAMLRERADRSSTRKQETLAQIREIIKSATLPLGNVSKRAIGDLEALAATVTDPGAKALVESQITRLRGAKFVG
jgi:hypothetical protein